MPRSYEHTIDVGPLRVEFGEAERGEMGRRKYAFRVWDIEWDKKKPVFQDDGFSIGTRMTFTNRSADAPIGPRARSGMSLDERMRERFQKRNRANLSFVSNDHAILPDGRLKVFGRIQNNGGSTAARARVRVRILLENGGVAAEGETPLDPPIIPPQGTATFELPLDYRGPVGTIKAELVWIE